MSYKVVTTATTIYATRAGITSYADTAGVSTTSSYATSAGVSTTSSYATSAGVSTDVVGGVASVTDLNSSGISTLGITSSTQFTAQSINVSGIVTSIGGFISVANTSPVQISVSNGILTFTAVGIGSTSFILG